jgi:hypothetical protein
VFAGINISLTENRLHGNKKAGSATIESASLLKLEICISDK